MTGKSVISLRQSCLLGVRVEFLAKCGQEVSPLETQNRPTVSWSVYLRDLTPTSDRYSVSLHVSPVSKGRLGSVGVGRVSKEGLTLKIGVSF